MSNIGFIGGGNMATAIISGLVSSGHRLSASEKSEPARKNLAAQFRGITIYHDNRKLVTDNTVIVLAIKPQDAKTVCDEIRDRMTNDKIILTILAGVTSESIHGMLGNKGRIVRAMPNLPATIGKGMTAVCAGKHAQPKDVEICVEIMKATGDVVEVDEERIDWVTAISGSGPAYFFYFLECLMAAGKESGLEPEIIKQLVMQTGLGALELARRSDKTPSELRAMVTSKGGTTAAALAMLEENKFGEILNKAVNRARERADVWARLNG